MSETKTDITWQKDQDEVTKLVQIIAANKNWFLIETSSPEREQGFYFVRYNQVYVMFFMVKGVSSIIVPLGSIPELPADSCKEIKASERGQAVSGNYWLDSTGSGNSIPAHCDMKTEDEEDKYL